MQILRNIGMNILLRTPPGRQRLQGDEIGHFEFLSDFGFDHLDHIYHFFRANFMLVP